MLIATPPHVPRSHGAPRKTAAAVGKELLAHQEMLRDAVRGLKELEMVEDQIFQEMEAAEHRRRNRRSGPGLRDSWRMARQKRRTQNCKQFRVEKCDALTIRQGGSVFPDAGLVFNRHTHGPRLNRSELGASADRACRGDTPSAGRFLPQDENSQLPRTAPPGATEKQIQQSHYKPLRGVRRPAPVDEQSRASEGPAEQQNHAVHRRPSSRQSSQYGTPAAQKPTPAPPAHVHRGSRLSVPHPHPGLTILLDVHWESALSGIQTVCLAAVAAHGCPCVSHRQSTASTYTPASVTTPTLPHFSSPES
ncbi:hypothetical protein DIPPA_02831 [Diplonema papillatum]|nr:hypothetical protein DIPPA_02831 [Diplonema papillatum]